MELNSITILFDILIKISYFKNYPIICFKFVVYSKFCNILKLFILTIEKSVLFFNQIKKSIGS